MPCDDAELLITAYAVGSIEPDEIGALRTHLAACAGCRQDAAGYVAAATLLPLAVEPMQPPPALRTRLLATVYGEAAQLHAPTRPRTPWYRRAWAAIPSGRGLTLAGAAVAVAALLVAGWGVSRGTGGTPAAERTFAVRFDGTAVDPQARCNLTYDPETQNGVLRVDGLPAPTLGVRPGTYEVWLLRSDHSVTAAAFLTLQPDGQTWMAAVGGDLTRYDGVAATVEPAGGSPTPTGPMVLRATLHWSGGST